MDQIKELCLRCIELLDVETEAVTIVKINRTPCKTDLDTPLCESCLKYMRKMGRVKDEY
jgi:hypothetical protein